MGTQRINVEYREIGVPTDRALRYPWIWDPAHYQKKRQITLRAG